MKDKPIGTIHPKTTLFLRFHAGEANATNGKGYDLSTGPGSNPMVESKQTGKFFSLSWKEIITLAIAAGIDKKGA